MFHCETRERLKAIRKGKKLKKEEETRKWTTVFFKSTLFSCFTLATKFMIEKNEQGS